MARARREFLDAVTGLATPRARPGALWTGRYLGRFKPIKGEPAVAVPVAESSLDLEDVSIRIEPQAVPELRELAAQELAHDQELAERAKPSKRQKIRGVEETYRSAGKGAKELYQANPFFEEAAASDPVDAVTDWMDSVEVRRGKSHKALNKTKKGQAILAELASGNEFKGILDLLTWILTQNRSKRWDQVDWNMIRSLTEALADPWQRNVRREEFASGGAMDSFPAASGQDPLAQVLAGLDPKVERAAIVAGNLSQLELALDEVRDAYEAARSCMTKENRAVVRRRIKALEKLATEPWKIEELAVCDPEDQTRLCGLGALHQEAAEIMRACGKEGYQPLWPVTEARELLAKAERGGLDYSVESRLELALERLAPVARQAAAQELAPPPPTQRLEVLETEPDPEGQAVTLADLERARIPFPEEAPGQFALTLADAQAAVPFPTDDQAEAELTETVEPLDLWEPQERPPLAAPEPLALVAQPTQARLGELREPQAETWQPPGIEHASELSALWADLKDDEPAPRPAGPNRRWIAYARSQGHTPEEQQQIGAGEGNWAAMAWIRAGVLEWQELHPAAYAAGLQSNGDPSPELDDEIDAWLMEKADRDYQESLPPVDPQASMFAEPADHEEEEAQAEELMETWMPPVPKGEEITVRVWRPTYASHAVTLEGEPTTVTGQATAGTRKAQELMHQAALAIEAGDQNPSIAELPGARTYKGNISGATVGTLDRQGLIAKVPVGPDRPWDPKRLYELTDKGRKYIAAGWRYEQDHLPLTQAQRIRESAKDEESERRQSSRGLYQWAIIEPKDIEERDMLGGWIADHLESGFPWMVRPLNGHLMVKAPASENRARSREAMAELAEDLDRMGIPYRHDTNHVGQLDTGEWMTAADFQAEERAGFFIDPETPMRRNTAAGYRESIPRERWLTNNRRLWIVSCGKDKTAGKAKAGDLYTGPLFRAQYALAKKMAKLQIGEFNPKEDPDVAILSAKHGLVSDQCELEPYNQTMGKMGKQAREVWGRKVWEQIRKRLDRGERGAQVVVFASKSYIDPWREKAELAGVTVIEPLARLTMGNRRKELKRLIEMPKAEALAEIEHAAGGTVRTRRVELKQPEVQELAQPPVVPTLSEEEEARAELLKIRAASIAADMAEVNADRLAILHEKLGNVGRERQRAYDALDRADTGEKRDRAEARIRKATERYAALEIKVQALDPGSRPVDLD